MHKSHTALEAFSLSTIVIATKITHTFHSLTHRKVRPQFVEVRTLGRQKDLVEVIGERYIV